MAFHHLRRLAGPRRSRPVNRQLGAILAFVAGATNAGGFLAVQRYTSHMTGIISAIADDLATGGLSLALAGSASLLAFATGAACTAVMVNWAKRRRMHGAYALALMTEAVLLLLFGVLGANLTAFAHLMVPATVLLLCFIMGLQNAIITKISQAEIRTTHMTGIVTDLGIEIGRLLYWNRAHDANAIHFVRANRDKLFIHVSVLSLFFLGGLAGANGFKRFGFSATIPIACMLVLVAAPALIVDLRRTLRLHR
ncbi:MAG: DUF1275 domain-containing protein [Burkholderiales bacterium]|nr:DUF1275 domain-containing protein [Burkholderiales bacterium]MBW8894314.1 DUF1275 domain-containing protein [Burkholderiales bacterium]